MSIGLPQVIDRDGFAFFPQHVAELPTVEAVSMLGTVLTLEGFSSVQALRPRALSNAPPNTYSGNFGTEEFPLHSDLAHWAVPPRYIVLRCISGVQGVSTRIFDGRYLIDAIGRNKLRRALVQPRRPFRNGKQLLRLLDQRDSSDSPILRWDSLFLHPAMLESALVHAAVREYVAEIVADEITLLSPGDTLIIDNWRMLHGRSRAPEFAIGRHLERVYMGELH
jgi:L-asparagine oxygenase